MTDGKIEKHEILEISIFQKLKLIQITHIVTFVEFKFHSI